jgi:hypothetical protein
VADCYRCVVVMARSGDGVGVCQTCGALACRHDGERDLGAYDFVCGMCDSSRLSSSAGVPPPGRSGPGGGGGVSTGGPVVQPSGGGGGAVAAVYVSGPDFEERRPTIAEQSREHRMIFRDRIDDVLLRLRESVHGDPAAALASVEAEELDPGRVSATAKLFVAQIDLAEQQGRLDRELLADAFGVAAWSIGAEPGREPDVGRLSHLADARMRLVVGRFTPLVA